MPCCGRSPLERLGDRITLLPKLVTCRGAVLPEREDAETVVSASGGQAGQGDVQPAPEERSGPASTRSESMAATPACS